MRTYCKVSCIAALTLLIVHVAIFANPIITHRYTADPNAMVYNGRIYVYCSHDNYNNNSYDMKGYILVSSDDMKNWYDHGEVFQVPRDASWAGLAYAPGAIEHNGKIYLYFPNGGQNIGVAVADRPEGPFTDPIRRALITRNTPNSNVAWCFDPAIFVDDDGQAYLYYGGGANASSPHGENLRGIRLNRDMISVSGSAVTIPARNSFEAAFLHKYNGTYYFTYSTNFSESAPRIDYLTSNNPLTGFTYRGVVLDNPTLGGSNINGHNNNHASIIEFKDNWYIFYHDRRISRQAYFRNACVDLLHYNSDGTIRKVVVTADGPPQIKNVNPYDTIPAALIGRQRGINTAASSEGGRMLTEVSDGDWVRINGVDFGSGASRFNVRAASATTGGRIELRLGSETGTLVGTCNIENTGGWTSWKTFSCNVSNVSNVQNLYLVFRGQGEPFRIGWYSFLSEQDEGNFVLSVATSGQGTVSRSPIQNSYEPGTEVTLSAQPADGWQLVGWEGVNGDTQSNPLIVTMNSNMAVTANFSRITDPDDSNFNLVTNGKFSDGLAPWVLNVWGEASASGSVSSGKYTVAISGLGESLWSIQLVQRNVPLETGRHYRLTFDASATSPRTMGVVVQMPDDPWTDYATGDVALTTSTQSFTFDFEMTHGSNTDSRVGFNFGTSTHDVTISNVRLAYGPATSFGSPRLSVEKGVPEGLFFRNNTLTITGDIIGGTTVSVYNLKGALVYRRADINYDVLNFNEILNRGSYILQVQNGEKVLIERNVTMF